MEDKIDFVLQIKKSFLRNNVHDPVTKNDLLSVIPNVKFHKTFVNNENVQITKKYEQYKNVPSSVRITTICCIVAREISYRIKIKKPVYTIEMFISEIVFVSNEIIRNNFSFVGTLFKSFFLQDIQKVMLEAKPTWPTRLYNDDSTFPYFTINQTTQNTSHINKEIPIDDLTNFIEGKTNSPTFDHLEAINYLKKKWMEAA